MSATRIIKKNLTTQRKKRREIIDNMIENIIRRWPSLPETEKERCHSFLIKEATEKQLTCFLTGIGELPGVGLDQAQLREEND